MFSGDGTFKFDVEAPKINASGTSLRFKSPQLETLILRFA